MAKMRLPTRIAASQALMLLASLAIVLVTFFAFEGARNQTAQVHDSYIPSIDIGKRLLLSLERMEYAEFMYFAPGQDRAEWMQHFDEAAQAFEAGYIQAENVANSPEEQRYFARIGHHYGAFLHIDGRMRELIRRGQVDAARSLNASESVKAATQVRENADAFYAFNLAESERARVAEERMIWHAELLALSLMILSALAAGINWWRTSRALVAPIQALQSGMEELAAGRFATIAHPAAERTHELDALQSAFNQTSTQLQDMTGRLQSANVTLEAEISERTRALREANRQLEDLLENMRTVDKLKTNFIAVTSHELLTPINFITGFGSALEDGLMGPLSPQQATAVNKIMQGAERLTRMVRNTLEYSQLEAGTLQVAPEAIDLAGVAQEAVDRIRPQSEAKQQRLAVTIEQGLPRVWADADRVGQVLFELLDNAVKFTSEQGRVRVKVFRAAGGVAAEVSDTGIGIPTEALPQLFSPFYQVDFSSTRQHGGMGLGLAISRNLITRMGGTLEVNSQLGHGSTFRLTLPLAADAHSGEETHPA